MGADGSFVGRLGDLEGLLSLTTALGAILRRCFGEDD